MRQAMIPEILGRIKKILENIHLSPQHSPEPPDMQKHAEHFTPNGSPAI